MFHAKENILSFLLLVFLGLKYDFLISENIVQASSFYQLPVLNPKFMSL